MDTTKRQAAYRVDDLLSEIEEGAFSHPATTVMAAAEKALRTELAFIDDPEITDALRGAIEYGRRNDAPMMLQFVDTARALLEARCF